LRGFTALSDRLAPETVVDILNQYFDCQVPVIREHGGEILGELGYAPDRIAGLRAAKVVS